MSAGPIAIIDDDEAACDALVGLVRASGFAAVGFRSAAEFLRSDGFAETRCLIADMQMPQMNGLELHMHLLASGIPVPTILVTAYPNEATKARALRAGVLCYLAKPCSPTDLLDCIGLAAPRDGGAGLGDEGSKP